MWKVYHQGLNVQLRVRVDSNTIDSIWLGTIALPENVTFPNRSIKLKFARSCSKERAFAYTAAALNGSTVDHLRHGFAYIPLFFAFMRKATSSWQWLARVEIQAVAGPSAQS
jgi:hypothetical protein